MPGIKHLIECFCKLKIMENSNFNHKFPVYSKINENGKIIKKNVKCNNCEAFHEVYEIGKSNIIAGKDQSGSVLTKNDISLSLPEQLIKIFERYNSDFSSYEHAIDILEEKRWGEIIVLKRDIIKEKENVKFVEINGKNNFKIVSEIIENLIL